MAMPHELTAHLRAKREVAKNNDDQCCEQVESDTTFNQGDGSMTGNKVVKKVELPKKVMPKPVKKNVQIEKKTEMVHTTHSGQQNDDFIEMEDDNEAILFHVEARKPKILEGRYHADIVAVEKHTTKRNNKEFPGIKIVFAVMDDEGKKVKVNLFLTFSKHSESRFQWYMERILGEKIHGTIDLRTIIGTEVKVKVEHYEADNGDIWENIVSVQRLSY